MLLQEYLAHGFKSGTIHSIHWIRTLGDREVLKDYRGRIKKETIGNFRIGVTFGNMAINKNKIVGSLPYGYFEFANEIIYSPTSNTHQLRLTKTMNKNSKPIVNWYLDNKPITKEELISMNALGSSQRKDNKEEVIVFNVKLNDIVEIK